MIAGVDGQGIDPCEFFSWSWNSRYVYDILPYRNSSIQYCITFCATDVLCIAKCVA